MLVSLFKTLVSAYQQEGKRSAVEMILAHKDEPIHLQKLSPDDYFKFIAASINAKRYKLSKTDEFSVHIDGELDMEDLYWYNKDIYSMFGYTITPKDGFAAFFEHYTELHDWLGEKAFAGLVYFIRMFNQYMEEKNRIYQLEDELEADVIAPALEYALLKVDASRSEREMVSYIVMAFQSQFIRLQMEINGTKRLGRRDADGNWQAVYVKPTYSEGDSWRMIFGNVDRDKAYKTLSKAQKALVDWMVDIIEGDFGSKENVLDNYKVDEHGQYKIKFRYMSEKLGIEESNLRKRFRKIQQKAKEIAS
jgi:hypothetical protein